MTYLELLQRAKIETGIAGLAPTTAQNLSGEMLRLATWVQQSWIDLCNERSDWHFLRREVVFNTVAGQQMYHVGTGLDIDVADFKKWRNYSFRLYLTSAGVGTEIPLTQYTNYTEFRDYFLLGTRKLVTARPMYFTINPSDKAILLGFTPNDIYTVTGEYFAKCPRLVNDSDEPVMPEDFHMLVVYRTMKKYGMFEVANEQVTSAKEEYSQMYNRLVAEWTDQVQLGSSLI